MKRYIKSAVRLYESEDDGSRFEIARDGTSERIIRDIAETETSDTVLMALAYNQNTPADVLLDVVDKSDNTQVAKFALRNSNASVQLIDKLFRSPFAIGEYAREYILRQANDSHVSVDQDFLRKCAISQIPAIRGAVASNPMASEDVQCLLANDSNYEVLWALVHNDLICKRCLELLTKNSDEDICKTARSRLSEGDYLE